MGNKRATAFTAFFLPQIAARDLDVPIGGQLPPSNLPLGDEFEPSPVTVIAFEAAFRRRGFRKQDLEHAPGNAHDTLIFADADAELDGASFEVPPSVGWEAEEHRPASVFC
jgi:hypothetical protein